jgi:hypothetical protein
MQQIGGLLVRERAKVVSAAAQGDWPRWARRANALGGVGLVRASSGRAVDLGALLQLNFTAYCG